MVVAVALARTMTERPTTTNPGAWLLAMATGATWATNAVGADHRIAGAVVAIGAATWGWRGRSGLGALWLGVGAVAVAVVAAEALAG